MLESGDERRMKTGYKTKIVEKLEEENAELKRLLKLAVKDIDLAMSETVCSMCKVTRCDCNKSTPCTWQHQDEVMKVIGEENE